MPIEYYPTLQEYIDSLDFDEKQIDQSRDELLKGLKQFISDKILKRQRINLLFVCTHNSRRSHFGQIWATVAAHYFGLDEFIRTFSGGTEVTAFNPRAVAALVRSGFRIESNSGDNPHYQIHYAGDQSPLECYSKKYSDPSISTNDLVAIMTCSEADQDCPYIPGAQFRVPLHYEDPKIADDTPEEMSRYDERCRQIAEEMFYVFKMVKNEISQVV